ncbi:MAG: hypothetical protein II304_03420 [Bacteroidales bacterium]|nr:hypothetical protein [Bacteroidales bacterium]
MESVGFDILKIAYAKGEIKAECRKVCPDKFLCDDLTQEVTLIMMSKPDEVLVGLYERGELTKYIYKVAKNQYNSVTSPFFKQYKDFQRRSNDGDRKEI